MLSGDNRKFTLFNRGLVIACLNINSLTAHIDELRVFMEDSKIDILAVNESKLDDTINDDNSTYQVLKSFGKTGC